MSVLAEDGNLLPYPLDQYQVELTAAKTMDAIVNLGSVGRHALYDRNLHLTDAATTGGGMLTFIQTPGYAPVAVDDIYTVKEGLVLNEAAPGVLTNDTGTNLTAYQTGTPPPGVLALNTDGSFTYTPVGTSGAVETFQYFANNGMANSLPATVTITVTPPNVPPVANNDIATTPRNLSKIIYILTNDVDSDGTLVPTSVVLSSTTTTKGGTVAANPDGTVTYTPEGGGGPDYFWYTVNDDNGATSNEARVRVNRTRDAAVPAAAPASAPTSGRAHRSR
jgi:hypothetical protein